MHLPELPWYQAMAARALGEEQRSCRMMGDALRGWRAALGKTDPGFFATTPFFLSFVDDPPPSGAPIPLPLRAGGALCGQDTGRRGPAGRERPSQQRPVVLRALRRSAGRGLDRFLTGPRIPPGDGIENSCIFSSRRIAPIFPGGAPRLSARFFICSLPFFTGSLRLFGRGEPILFSPAAGKNPFLRAAFPLFPALSSAR